MSRDRTDSKTLWLPSMAALLCTIASFVIRGATGTLKVAGVYPSLGVSVVTALLVLGSLGLSLRFFVRACLRGDDVRMDPGKARVAAFGACLIAAPMLPMLSNDVFSVLAYGDLALQGIDVFSSGAGLSQSRFYAWVASGWADAPCVYGPVTVLISSACVWAAGGNLYASLAIFKLVSLAACLATVELAYRYACEQQERVDGQTLALVACSPILWLQGAGQAHSDLFSCMFLVGGILWIERGRHQWAAALIACAILNKLSAVFGAVFLIVYLCNAHRMDRRRLIRTLVESASVALLAGLVLYGGFWKGLATVTVPVLFLSDKRPSNSLVMLSAEAAVWAKTTAYGLVGQGRSLAEGFFQANLEPAMALQAKESVWRIAKPLFLIGGLTVTAYQLAPFVARRSNTEAVTSFAKVAVITLTLMAPVFQPWYLLVALPFFLQPMSRAWKIWLVLVSVLGNGQNFPQITDRHSLVCLVLDPLFTYSTIALFLYAFRERFLERPGSS